MTMENSPAPQLETDSPSWNWTTKLVIGLILAGIGFFFLIRFQNILGPLIMSFILAYIFYPVAELFRKATHLRWRASVTILYVLVALILIGLLTWGGLALAEQVQNLISFIQANINEIPALVNQITQQTYMIGPFQFNLSVLNWNDLVNQAISTVQPLLGQAGTLAGKLVSSSANFVFWIIIMMLISYFMLTETEGIPDRIINLKIPKYTEDLKRMSKEVGLIWNAFIRGQLIIVSAAVAVYTALLGALGMQYFFGLAFIAALGRFIPYVGAWITWITYGLVALLQAETPFGLTPGWYALLVIASALIVDNILDNILVPRVMSDALHVHPAAILVAALIGANLLGIIGVILAAPVLATLQLIANYLWKKLTDEDPWEALDDKPPPKRPRWLVFFALLWKKTSIWIKKNFQRLPKKTPGASDEDQSNKNLK